MIAWPSTLPQAPASEFSFATVAGLSSVEDELSQRRTRTYPEFEAKFLFEQCTAQQLQALRTFYDSILNQRAPFSAPWLEVAGFGHHFCQFTGPPSAEMVGLSFDITINVLIISGVPVDGMGAITYGAD